MSNRPRRRFRAFVVRPTSRWVEHYVFHGGDLPEQPKRIRTSTVALATPFVVLLAFAVRTMIAGSTAWESVLFSRYYVQLFVFFTIGIPTFRTLWREYDEWGFIGMIMLGIAVGITAGVLSPGHDASFCYAAKGMLYRSSRVVIPDVFRCTSVLWGIPASFVFWWTMIIRRRRGASS